MARSEWSAGDLFLSMSHHQANSDIFGMKVSITLTIRNLVTEKPNSLEF